MKPEFGENGIDLDQVRRAFFSIPKKKIFFQIDSTLDKKKNLFRLVLRL